MKKIFKKIIVATVVLVITVVMVFNYEPMEIKALTVTGSPGTSAGADDATTGCTNSGGNWLNPTNAASSNNAYASYGGTYFDANEISDELRVSNLGLSLPTGATIDGIVVEIEKHTAGGDNAVDYDVRLTKVAGTQIGTNKADTTTNWAQSDPNSYTSYGGASDLWGTTWTEAEVESSGFGLVFCGKSNNDANVDLNVDHISITVYYTPLPSVDLSGIAYQSEGGSTLNSKTLKIYKNGSTLLASPTTNVSDGTWSATGLNISSGDIINVYIDNDTTYKGNTVFVSDGTNKTDINIYSGDLILRHDTGSNITNANLSTGRVSGDAGDMMYSISGSDLTATTSAEVHIWTGDTFVPGGKVVTDGNSGNFHLDDNANATLATTNSVVAGNLTIDSGATLTISADTELGGNLINNGTFTHSAGTFKLINSLLTTTITSVSDMTFVSLKSTASGKTIKFQKQVAGSPKFIITGQFNIQGTNGNPIFIYSDTPGTQWYVYFNSIQNNISYVRVTDSGCAVGTALVGTDITILNGGNNGACWNFISRDASPPVGGESNSGGGSLRTGGSKKAIGSSVGTESGGGSVQTGGSVAPPVMVSP